MPRDGTFPEMSLEEKALRHADAFFTDESKWHRGSGCFGPGGSMGGTMCVGVVLIRGAEDALQCEYSREHQFRWATGALGLPQIYGQTVGHWNRACPDFATLKAHLKSRIEYYQNQRFKDSYIVIIGPGRQVKL